ncbi:glycosyltransferase family 4 protein [Butyrivibrio proteoclasticus]|uniref:glycosyltransferase family 4 protein n=1 Tax=Butyrivibrio proteoclasticus TaxID=43305 RepID=UPI001FA8D42D|nr:glycosyltransferase family 4 protein [Butyrivibrio proteoclasticus]
MQRYGLEVNGGAELQCRQFAEHMVKHCNRLDVVTTKAVDYMTWKDYYTADEEDINGVHVIRFGVERERDQKSFRKLNDIAGEQKLPVDKEEEWAKRQGPYSPDLLKYLEDNHYNYDAFVFFTYIYYPTVMGLSIVADRAILVPEAHDEPYLSMQIIKKVFSSPKAFLFNTEEERELVHKRFNNADIPSQLGGIGIELPDEVHPENFRQKYKIGDAPFLVYVGRIDEGKNCRELVEFFLEYKRRHNDDLKLVLIGKKVLDIPKNKDIIETGFTSDQDKFDGIAAANALVLPSRFESLSIVVLEAMKLNTLVLVDGHCDVLRAHCKKSNGALYYVNYPEFEGCLEYFKEHPEVCDALRANGLKYVDENYQWDVVTGRICELIQKIKDSSVKE